MSTTVAGAQFNVFTSSSLSSGTPVTGSTILTEGCNKLVLQFSFNGTAAVVGSGVSGSFGLQRSVDGTTWENIGPHGLIPGSFIVVSGTLIDGVEQGTGVAESSVKCYEFDKPGFNIRPVFLPKVSRGSITGFGRKW